MREDWDVRARHNAYFYVDSSREDWTDQEFLTSGEDLVRELVRKDLAWICGGKSPGEMQVLEIGCGAGRMTLPLARIFGEVHAVDVSGEMVARARRHLAGRLNAFIHQNNGSDLGVLGGLKFDFVFSFIVFQHIPCKEIVENYVREAAWRLRPGGVFKFQIQGAQTGGGREADTWAGVAFSPAEASAMAERGGFTVDKTSGEGTQYFWLWCSDGTVSGRPQPGNSDMSFSPSTNTAEVQRRMREDWDARARENAFYYIASSRDDWTDEEFFASGEESVRVLAGEDLDAICRGKSPAKMRMLEIGCGAGRMTRAFSKIFGEVHGVDVSGEMVAKARRLLADRLNAFIHRNSGSDLRVLGDLKFDFVFSFIVFQHIPSKEVVENYIREAARRLKPGGVFKFQIQGAATAEGQEADTWVGVSFSPAEAQAIVERCGLGIDKTDGEGTQYFWLWCTKPTLWETWKRAWKRNDWFEGLRQRRA